VAKRRRITNGEARVVMLRSRALRLVFMVFVLGCVAGALSAQTPAGVRMAFDVASVKPDMSDAPASSRFPLGPGDGYAPGGLFSATNQPLVVYLRFAY
jgi:hypothetical protein